MESVLLSVLSVLAALGEVRPLERRSSLVGEALPSGLAVCFLRPLRSVDICKQQTEQSHESGVQCGDDGGGGHSEARTKMIERCQGCHFVTSRQLGRLLFCSRGPCYKVRIGFLKVKTEVHMESGAVSVPSLGSVGSSCYASR